MSSEIGPGTPADDTPLPFQRRQVARVAVTTAATAFPLGYVVSRVSGAEALTGLIRTALAVAAVALLLSIGEIRLARHLVRIEDRQEAFERRIEARLAEAQYAEGYVDGLKRRPPDDGDGPHLRSV